MKTYQIFIRLDKTSHINIGRLGHFEFLAGDYVYTGSAKINIDARIKRHVCVKKKNHWHVDYFLDNPETKILSIEKSVLTECELNQQTNGDILLPGFGSSDCTNKCRSHLKYLR